jgi:hypothetical protein
MDENFEYDAILIDTSIFDANGLRLEKGLLSKLSQFKRSPVEIVFPDVIRGEVKAHLAKKIKESRSALEKAINDAGDHLFLKEDSLAKAKELIAESLDVDALAETRIADFIEAVGGTDFECGKNLEISALLEKYFKNLAPFAESGKKKNEFPDAITLLAVDNWAAANNKRVLAISQDGDWKAYCEASKYMECSESLSDVLTAYNKANPVYGLIGKLENAIEANAAQDFIKEVESKLDSVLDDFTPDQDADSAFYWEPEGCSGRFNRFELSTPQLRLIEHGNGFIVLELDAEITVDVEGEFSLSVHDSIDGDYVPIDSCTVEVEESFHSKILVTLTAEFGDGSENLDISDLEVEDVEVVSVPKTIHFGTLEPFQDEYD